MRFTQGALGMLVQRYRGILKKCRLLNALGGVVVSALLLGGGNIDPPPEKYAIEKFVFLI